MSAGSPEAANTAPPTAAPSPMPTFDAELFTAAERSGDSDRARRQAAVQNTGIAPKPTTQAATAVTVPDVEVCSTSSAATHTAPSTSAPRNPARGRRSITRPGQPEPDDAGRAEQEQRGADRGLRHAGSQQHRGDVGVQRVVPEERDGVHDRGAGEGAARPRASRGVPRRPVAGGSAAAVTSAASSPPIASAPKAARQSSAAPMEVTSGTPST